jgi:hypothetical protein
MGSARQRCQWSRRSSGPGTTGHSDSGPLDQNRAESTGILTQGSLTAGWAPRRLVAMAGLVLLLGSMCDFSNSPLMTNRPPVGVGASPRAHRLLQFARRLVETRAHGSIGFQALAKKMSASGGSFYRVF